MDSCSYYADNVSKIVSYTSDNYSVILQKSEQGDNCLLLDISVLVLYSYTFSYDRNYHISFYLQHCDSLCNAYDYEFL